MATIYPHLTSTGLAPNYRDVVQRYLEIFNERVAEGTLRPLVLPYHLYGIYILTIYLCIRHTNRPWLYSARWPVLAIMTWWQWKTISGISSANFAVAFAVGLTAAWGVVWSTTWLVWCRPQFDAKRVQRRKKAKGHQASTSKIGSAIQTNGVKPARPESNGKLTSRAKIGTGNGHKIKHGAESDNASDVQDEEEWEYYWQSYPDDLSERIPWLLDLLCNFRGPGWNWAIAPLPALNPKLKSELGESMEPTGRKGDIGLKRFDTIGELIRYRIAYFILGYCLLDIVKTTMVKDPYFIFGPTTYALPSHLHSFSPTMLNLYRRALSCIAIVTAVEMEFMLAPLILCYVLGPHVLGLRGEAWYYPTTWGSFNNILEKGLNGLWGSWWHQTFRFAFAAPTNWAIGNGYVNARSMGARVLALVSAFGISGFLHGAGSTSQLPRTYPWHALIFFMLQAVGIILQITVSSAINSKKFPTWSRKAGNLGFTIVWLYATSWWLVDDFARGGLWLFEPIPISPLRALGFGVEGDWWWCWEHVGVGWYTGKHWWESGIAI